MLIIFLKFTADEFKIKSPKKGHTKQTITSEDCSHGDN